MTVFETDADTRGRVALSRAGATPGQRYRVEAHADGEIRLTPMVSVPAREMHLLRDPGLAQRIADGMADAAQGRTHNLGDFSSYAR